MKALRYILAALVVSVASADTYYEKTTIPPTIAANKVLGNGTASTAAPQQLAVGSCSTTASALIWTTSTGFGCNTTINAGTLGGATFAAPGAIGGGTPGAGAFTTLTSSSGIPLSSLATQATNTVVGNATSGTAVPTALAVGTCSTSSSALIWTTNTGFGCNTSVNAATLGGATFASPGAIGGTVAAAGTFTATTVLPASGNAVDTVNAFTGNTNQALTIYQLSASSKFEAGLDSVNNGGEYFIYDFGRGYAFKILPNGNMQLMPASGNVDIATSGATTTINGTLKSPALMSVGTKFTATGTGACATITTTLGGASAGSMLCTGTAGAGTITITINGATGLTAPTGWACTGGDATSGVAWSPSGSAVTTTGTMSGVIATTSDRVVFHCTGY